MSVVSTGEDETFVRYCGVLPMWFEVLERNSVFQYILQYGIDEAVKRYDDSSDLFKAFDSTPERCEVSYLFKVDESRHHMIGSYQTLMHISRLRKLVVLCIRPGIDVWFPW